MRFVICVRALLSLFASICVTNVAVATDADLSYRYTTNTVPFLVTYSERILSASDVTLVERSQEAGVSLYSARVGKTLKGAAEEVGSRLYFIIDAERLGKTVAVATKKPALLFIKEKLNPEFLKRYGIETEASPLYLLSGDGTIAETAKRTKAVQDYVQVVKQVGKRFSWVSNYLKHEDSLLRESALRAIGVREAAEVRYCKLLVQALAAKDTSPRSKDHVVALLRFSGTRETDAILAGLLKNERVTKNTRFKVMQSFRNDPTSFSLLKVWSKSDAKISALIEELLAEDRFALRRRLDQKSAAALKQRLGQKNRELRLLAVEDARWYAYRSEVAEVLIELFLDEKEAASLKASVCKTLSSYWDMLAAERLQKLIMNSEIRKERRLAAIGILTPMHPESLRSFILDELSMQLETEELRQCARKALESTHKDQK